MKVLEDHNAEVNSMHSAYLIVFSFDVVNTIFK